MSVIGQQGVPIKTAKEDETMQFASPDAPLRSDYIEVGHGVSLQFNPAHRPEIVWKHIDGPLLYLRNGQIHWLTFRERFLCWIGRADALSIEQKLEPDFVRRWNERAALR